MHVITYNLRAEAINSDNYYQDIATFTDEVLIEFDRTLGPITTKFAAWACSIPDSIPRTEHEYAFELLALGTYWRIYSGDASVLDPVPRQLLAGLLDLRRQGGVFKPGVDFLRGIFSTLFLAPDLYDHLFMLATDPQHIAKLLDWLDATGEFAEEIKRLRLWQIWLKTLPDNDAVGLLGASLSVATWFESRSFEVLGKYTTEVDRYLNEKRPARYWKEDVIFCGRRRTEYHLNMLGAELMNRTLRAEFRAAKQKLVVIPACMRQRRPEDCRAIESSAGLKCTSCSPGCDVAHLVSLGKTSGFSVAMIPHESSLSAARSDSSFIPPGTGVVGVACVLNLVTGGWMLRDRGIPTQCVLLDGCGCRKHWSDEGMPTAINIGQLQKIVGAQHLLC